MLESFKKKYKPYDFSSSCSFYLAVIIVALIMQAVAGVVSSALAGSVPDIAANPDFNSAFMIVFQVANIGVILLYSFVKRRRFNFACAVREDGRGLCPADIIVPVIAAAVLMAAMYLPTVWYGYLTQAMGIPPDAGSIELNTSSSVVMLVLASVLFAPVCEETVYRGVLFHGLSEKYTPVKAIMLCAFAFMIMHMSPLQVVFQFALGALSAYLVMRSGKLLPSILLHASANALALVMQMTPLADVLAGCVEWLTQNVAAAVFITLGLFAAGGAALVFGIDGVYGGDMTKKLFKKRVPAPDACAAPVTPEEVRQAASDEIKRKDGILKYWIAAGICVIMFIVNFVVSVMPK